jgi:hypothetical protein
MAGFHVKRKTYCVRKVFTVNKRLMHIQKLLAMISVGAIFSAVSLQAQSADSDLQAKAREAMRQKMAELGTKPALTNKPVPAPPQPVVPAPPPAPVEPVVVIPPPPAAVPAPAVLPPAAVVTSPPQVASPELQAQALEALRQKKAELDAQEPTVAVKTPAAPMSPIAPAPMTMPKTTSTPATTPAFPVMPGPQYVTPSTMLSGSKEQRLAELLQLYRTDKITPAEYHQQRAKILGEP